MEYYKAGANRLTGPGGKLLLADVEAEPREDDKDAAKAVEGDIGTELFNIVENSPVPVITSTQMVSHELVPVVVSLFGSFKGMLSELFGRLPVDLPF